MGHTHFVHPLSLGLWELLSDKDQENVTEQGLSVCQNCAAKYIYPSGTLAGKDVGPNKGSVASLYTGQKFLIDGPVFTCLLNFFYVITDCTPYTTFWFTESFQFFQTKSKSANTVHTVKKMYIWGKPPFRGCKEKYGLCAPWNVFMCPLFLCIFLSGPEQIALLVWHGHMPFKKLSIFANIEKTAQMYRWVVLV